MAKFLDESLKSLGVFKKVSRNNFSEVTYLDIFARSYVSIKIIDGGS